MGYDHYALVAVKGTATAYDAVAVTLTCLEIKLTTTPPCQVIPEDPLIGFVHHLCSGNFGEYWEELFDQFMEELHLRTEVETLYLYLCECDGESLRRIVFHSGKRTEEQYVKEIYPDDVVVTKEVGSSLPSEI